MKDANDTMDIKGASSLQNVRIVGDAEDVSGVKDVEAPDNDEDTKGTTDPALTKDLGPTDNSGDQPMSN